MLPSILAKQLEKGIEDYIQTTFPMTNEPFKGSLKTMLKTPGSVYHEPYVSVRLPFRVAEEMPTCFDGVEPEYLPFVHQQKAFDRLAGDDPMSTLVATGTGSGKTECFLYPVVDYCYRHCGEPGIKVLLIYPMNALASDQAERIAKLIYQNPKLRGNVRVGMYVGGFDDKKHTGMGEKTVITDRTAMLNNPPDILITNYKMLDYLLVRPRDAELWAENKPWTLKYIVVDELHTFDGAQGTDLACLLRRLKKRLGTEDGYLCCVGTSATMGSGDASEQVIEYARKVFGEPFDDDAVITEDRLSPDELFAEYEITDFTFPSPLQISTLGSCVLSEDEQQYLKLAAQAWLSETDGDLFSDEARVALGNHLMHHGFLQALLTKMGGNYYQVSALKEQLLPEYPALNRFGDEECEQAFNALFALISHARKLSYGRIVPFLNVQVQLWMRELRRLVGRVGSEVSYAVAYDLNQQQAEHYLPVINCRDCGATGWVTLPNERHRASIPNLESFYNFFFSGDTRISMLFPDSDGRERPGFIPAKLCPDCMFVQPDERGTGTCSNCGNENTIRVLMPTNLRARHKQYVCPFCDSRNGLSLMGLRGAMEISASLSQLFASKFNDDKKTLAFSDNVQDAAHRAGFFEARTWKFGLRTAIQQYLHHGGGERSFEDFTRGFLTYWHEKLSKEDYISFFIAPNMTWMKAYEDMLENRELSDGPLATRLIQYVDQRVAYEIMLEYGVASGIGRTLPKSGCSAVGWNREEILSVASIVRERVVNEIGAYSGVPEDHFACMVFGYLDMLRKNGAFDDPVFRPVTANGNTYMLSNNRLRWMPGNQGGRYDPRFIAEKGEAARQIDLFDDVANRKIQEWIRACADEEFTVQGTERETARIIFEELRKAELLIEMPSPPGYSVYALSRAKMFISDRVALFRCTDCGTLYPVARENAEFMDGAPCSRRSCYGVLEPAPDAALDYYGRLYNDGDMARINAREHTGMLERNDREALEGDFKRKKTERRLWDPNVLSCTPTLEMGIDIGDLSSVILCSVPPAQAQFQQRVGRAGRKDGNALVLAVAAAKPHDLYFYADPMDMISGSVAAPNVFLKASAVLERQFVAYCLDSWVKQGVPEKAIPEKGIGICINNLDTRNPDVFPFNFLDYVGKNMTYLLNRFMLMFAGDIDKNVENAIRDFARGKGLTETSMQYKILEAFQSAKRQREALRKDVEALKESIRALEAKPKDSSYDDQIRELRSEMHALLKVIEGIVSKNVFNFLSDEGLLPNYAFPEEGIILKAVLYRREEKAEQDDEKAEKKYDKKVLEYSRSASTAISEFAPSNNFYAGGRKLTIDQVDMTTASLDSWRLCPNCEHTERITPSTPKAACPRCGSTAWADQGQVKPMLKVQMVYSNMDDTRSRIGDESEDRAPVFYTKQLLVDVDEAHDIEKAYRYDNPDFHFGYEFVRKAVLREINFGESESMGEKLLVAGEEAVRKGFRVCKYCGKIQKGDSPEHMFTCKTRKDPMLLGGAIEDYLFLYREFQTEALRILIPATTEAVDTVRTQSFLAAFMLGMKEYFGNVDHLRATVSDVPVPDDYRRKQYLVIYDSVPGGTGYLKELMSKANSLIEIFEKALAVMEHCTCKDDRQKDGCYHCLYAYRQSRSIGDISRREAMALLKSILSGKELIEIEHLSDIPVNSILDSELERRFVTALNTMGNDTRKVEVSGALVRRKNGYNIQINGITWEIEPQVDLGPDDGVSVPCRPDYVFWPVTQPERMPVAVFTDGFRYHKDIVGDDTLKRMSILKSGKYRVWSLSYNDVDSVFNASSDYATVTLDPNKMPAGNLFYSRSLNGEAGNILPGKMSSMELLLRYLYLDSADEEFSLQAMAISRSLLEPAKAKDPSAYAAWAEVFEKVSEQTVFCGEAASAGNYFFGAWAPRGAEACLHFYSGITPAILQADPSAAAAVCVYLEDREEHRNEKYEAEWNGMLQFMNVMQFNPKFIAVTSSGLEDMIYMPLASVAAAASGVMDVEDDWNDVYEMIYDDQAKQIAHQMKDIGIPKPTGYGEDILGPSEEVIGNAEMLWNDMKIAYLTEEQLPDRAALESAGWKIITAETALNQAFWEGQS